MNMEVSSSLLKPLEIAAPNCVADDFGGEIVALNLDSGYYFSFRDLAGAVWRDLVNRHPATDVIENLAAVDTQAADQARDLVTAILRHKLMRPASDLSPPAAELESRRLAASGITGLTFESYDDMRDLVMNDPVHDVDE